MSDVQVFGSLVTTFSLPLLLAAIVVGTAALVVLAAEYRQLAETYVARSVVAPPANEDQIIQRRTFILRVVNVAGLELRQSAKATYLRVQSAFDH